MIVVSVLVIFDVKFKGHMFKLNFENVRQLVYENIKVEYLVGIKI